MAAVTSSTLMPLNLTVVCVKSPPAYDHLYVNRLYAGVKRNLTVPHRFVCLTDDSSGCKCATRSLPGGLRGWWAKLAIFAKAWSGLVIYFDLDTLITGNLDFLTKYEGDFAILRDFYRPDGYGSGMMLWNKRQPQLWTDWVSAGGPDHAHGDQGWIEDRMPGADLLQDLYPGRIVSYKEHCASGLPVGASVVCHHGTPKPHDFEPGHWVSRAWAGELRASA